MRNDQGRLTRGGESLRMRIGLPRVEWRTGFPPGRAVPLGPESPGWAAEKKASIRWESFTDPEEVPAPETLIPPIPRLSSSTTVAVAWTVARVALAALLRFRTKL